MDSINSIAITGIDTGHADEVLKDGATEDIFNLRFENGGLQQVYDLTAIDAIEDEFSSILTSWIILKPTFLDEHHYLYYEGPNVIGHQGAGFIAEAVAEYDSSDHYVLHKVKEVFRFPSIAESPINPSEIGILQFGNVIYINYGEKEWSYLFKMGNYIQINIDSLPELSFKSDVRYYSLTDDNGGHMVTTHTDFSDHADLLETTEVLKATLTTQNGRWEAVEIIDQYATYIAEINFKGYIVGEFKVALAYRLYDGTLIKASEPQFITSFKKLRVMKDGETPSVYCPYTIASIIDTSTGSEKLGFFDNLTGCVASLEIDNLQEVISAVDGDIITEVVIIATRPQMPYNYHDALGKCGFLGTRAFHTLFNPYKIDIKTLSRMDISEAEHYKLDKDVWYEVKKIDFDNLDTSCNLEHDTLKDIEHNVVVEPNYSHHTLTSARMFDYNSRLHRWNVKNLLHHGYDLGIGDLDSELYEIKRAKEYLRVKYGTTQIKPSRVSAITYVAPSSSNEDKFQFATYKDRHGEEFTGYFPAFKFTSSVDIRPEDDVTISVKYTFTRGSSSGEVEVNFKNVELRSGGYINYLVDMNPARIAMASEISGSSPVVTTSIDQSQGQGTTIIDTEHEVKYITISETELFALVTIKVNNQFRVVRKNFTGWTFVNAGTTYYAVQNYFVYPDARAIQVRFGKEGATPSENYLSSTLNLIRDDGNNQTFAWLNPIPVCDRADSNEYFDNSATPVPAYVFTLSSTSIEIPTTNEPIYENNKLYVSEESNPFYNNPKNIYTIGQVATRIVDIDASIERLTETKFGYFPLYIFCNDGVYSMEQGNDIVYQSVQKVSSEVKLENTTSVAIGTSVIFIGNSGVMELSRRDANCISKNLELHPALSRYDNTIEDFRRRMRNAKLMYNQQYRELIVQVGTDAYVFGLQEKQWTRRALEGRLLDGLRTLLRTGGVYDLWQEDRTKPLTPARIYTRAVKLGTHEFKRLRRAILRERHDPSASGSVGTTFTAKLQGSNDLKTWTNIQTINTEDMFRLIPCSYKYYRFVIDVTMGEYFTMTGIDIESYNRFIHRLR